MDRGIPKLRPLKDSAYTDFMEGVRERYAGSRMKGNLLTEEEAARFTENEWAALLPNSKETPDHFFFEIIDGNTDKQIGITWLFINRDTHSAFIFEIYLEQSARGKGLGRGTLTAIESFAKSEGATTLGLNVFAENSTAISLYLSFGFQEVSTDMIKEL